MEVRELLSEFRKKPSKKAIMKKIRLVLVIVVGVFFVLFSGRGLYADSIENLLEAPQISALKAGNRLMEIQFRDIRLKLIPQHEDVRRLVETIRGDLAPSIVVETLHLYQKPGEAVEGWTQEEKTALYNEAIAISTLQGIQYYSASRGVMRIFYETSSVIDGPSTKKALPDPSFVTPPGELTLFARQKDSTFGDNIYQYKYLSLPGALVFVQENLTSLYAGIIPAVAKNRLHSVLALFDAGDFLIIYAVSMAKAASLPGLRDRIGDSFSNRAAAIIDWLVSGADRAFRKTK
jgi:hypothetical protein